MDDMIFDNFDTLFNGTTIFIGLVFIVILVIIIVRLTVYAKNTVNNVRSPLLSVKAEVISKRDAIQIHRQSDGMGTSSTSYYVTFQLQNGERIELEVKGNEYGILLVGDKGMLHYQGTWFKGFDH